MKRLQTVTAATVILAVVLLAALFRTCEIPPVAPVLGGDLLPQGPAAEIDTSDSPSPKEVHSPESERSIRVRVRDESGDAVVNARVSSASASSRVLTRVESLGVTNSFGELLLSRDIRPPLLVVDATGFVCRDRRVEDQEDGVLLVELQRAASLAVLATTLEGTPVHGVSIALSSSLVSDRIVEHLRGQRLKIRPSGDAFASLHFGETDAEGRLFLDGLRPGQTYGRGWHASHVMVTGWPGGGLVLRPGENQIALVFAPLCGVYVSVVGDKLLDWYVKSPRGAATPFVSASQTESRRHYMMSQVENGICVLQCLNSDRLTLPANVTLQILLRDRGWSEVSASWRLLTERSIPEIVDVKSLPASPMVEFTASASTPSGTSLHGMELVLQASEGDRPEITIITGTSKRIPPGTYEFWSANPFIRDALTGQTINVMNSETLEIQLSKGVAPVELRLTDPFGDDLSVGQVAITSRDRTLAHVLGFRDKSVFWVPEGAIDVVVRAPGCQELRHQAIVQETRGGALALNSATLIALTMERIAR